MSDEDKLSILEEAKDSLQSILNDLNDYKKEFQHYITYISETINEMSAEIEELEERQSHIWQKEIDHANREYESMKF